MIYASDERQYETASVISNHEVLQSVRLVQFPLDKYLISHRIYYYFMNILGDIEFAVRLYHVPSLPDETLVDIWDGRYDKRSYRYPYTELLKLKGREKTGEISQIEAYTDKYNTGNSEGSRYGVLVFKFDNRSSWLAIKNLYYSIQIVKMININDTTAPEDKKSVDILQSNCEYMKELLAKEVAKADVECEKSLMLQNLVTKLMEQNSNYEKELVSKYETISPSTDDSSLAPASSPNPSPKPAPTLLQRINDLERARRNDAIYLLKVEGEKKILQQQLDHSNAQLNATADKWSLKLKQANDNIEYKEKQIKDIQNTVEALTKMNSVIQKECADYRREQENKAKVIEGLENNIAELTMQLNTALFAVREKEVEGSDLSTQLSAYINKRTSEKSTMTTPTITLDQEAMTEAVITTEKSTATTMTASDFIAIERVHEENTEYKNQLHESEVMNCSITNKITELKGLQQLLEAKLNAAQVEIQDKTNQITVLMERVYVTRVSSCTMTDVTSSQLDERDKKLEELGLHADARSSDITALTADSTRLKDNLLLTEKKLNMLTNECQGFKDELKSTQQKLGEKQSEYQALADELMSAQQKVKEYQSSTTNGGVSSSAKNTKSEPPQQNRVTFRKSSISPPSTKLEYIEDEYKSNLKARRSTVTGANLGPPKRPTPTVTKPAAVVTRRPTFSPATAPPSIDKAAMYPMSVMSPMQQQGSSGLFTVPLQGSPRRESVQVSPRRESVQVRKESVQVNAYADTSTLRPRETQPDPTPRYASRTTSSIYKVFTPAIEEEAPTPRYASRTTSSISKVFTPAIEEEDDDFVHTLSKAHKAAGSVLRDPPPKHEENMQDITFGAATLFTGLLSPLTATIGASGSADTSTAVTQETLNLFNFGLFGTEARPSSSGDEIQAENQQTGLFDFFGTTSGKKAAVGAVGSTTAPASETGYFNLGFLANVLPLTDETKGVTPDTVLPPPVTPSKLAQRRSSNYAGAKSSLVGTDNTRMSATADAYAYESSKPPAASQNTAVNMTTSNDSRQRVDAYAYESSRAPAASQGTRMSMTAPMDDSRQRVDVYSYESSRAPAASQGTRMSMTVPIDDSRQRVDAYSYESSRAPAASQGTRMSMTAPIDDSRQRVDAYSYESSRAPAASQDTRMSMVAPMDDSRQRVDCLLYTSDAADE